MKHPILILFSIFLFSCATGPKRTGVTAVDRAQDAVAAACSDLNSGIKKGKLWLRIDAQKRSIQLPATFAFDGQNFVLDVGTVLGGTVLQANGTLEKMTVQSGMNPDFDAKDVTEWVGIPVRWMTSLLMNGLVCPDPKTWQNPAWYPETEEFMILSGVNLWAFHLVEFQGRNRIDHIRLMNQKSGSKINFKAEDWNAQGKVRRGLIETSEGKFGWSWRSIDQ